jgi:hypothetical protein
MRQRSLRRCHLARALAAGATKPWVTRNWHRRFSCFKPLICFISEATPGGVKQPIQRDDGRMERLMQRLG